jgi:hypothetical protein
MGYHADNAIVWRRAIRQLSAMGQGVGADRFERGAGQRHLALLRSDRGKDSLTFLRFPHRELGKETAR